MTLADTMLMILEISSKSGIWDWEVSCQTVNQGDQPQACLTHADLEALGYFSLDLV